MQRRIKNERSLTRPELKQNTTNGSSQWDRWITLINQTQIDYAISPDNPIEKARTLLISTWSLTVKRGLCRFLKEPSQLMLQATLGQLWLHTQTLVLWDWWWEQTDLRYVSLCSTPCGCQCVCCLFCLSEYEIWKSTPVQCWVCVVHDYRRYRPLRKA